MVWFGVWDSRVLNTYGCVVSAEIYKSKVTTIYNIYFYVSSILPPKFLATCELRSAPVRIYVVSRYEVTLPSVA